LESNNNYKQKILIAEDDVQINSMFSAFLETNGYEVISTSNGKDAVEKEELTRPDLVILDVNMPGMDGFEACRMIKNKRSGANYTPVMFLSGSIDENIISKGLQLGADDYVKKPFSLNEVLSRIKNLIKMKYLVAQMESIDNVVTSMIKSIETRNFYTSGHSQRVADISMKIGIEMGLSDEESEILHKGALLHDIGKIGISDQILNKREKLNELEFNLIKEHPVIGMEICGNLRFPPLVLGIILHHHEKLDGSGYPDRLKEKDIHKLIRIISVVDIYDALTTDRPYRPAKNNEETFLILEKETEEGKLDLTVLNCLKKIKQQ
jgi:putative two-component system response regulator